MTDERFLKAASAVLKNVRIIDYQAEYYDVATQTAGALPT
jgi:hypothetical protein